MPGLVSIGVKRKHHALDEGGGSDAKDCIPGCHGDPPPPSQDKWSSYTMQRKCVMNASICKLQATCNLIDPSLRRSVLIRNTLLHIDHELRAEGRHQDSYQLSTFIASTQSTCTDTADKDRLPGADTNSALNSPKDNNSNHYKDVHSRDSAKLFNAHLENSGLLNRTSIHSCANSSLLSLSTATTLSTSISNSSTGQSNVHITTNTVLLNSGIHPVPSTANSELMRLPGTNSEILDFGDELFSNIDIDLYDFDTCIAPPFVSSHKASPVMPLSSSNSSSEDWLRPVSGEYSFSSDVSSTTTSQGNNCRSDITCDELDQIMHVLVDVGM
ncbi:SERTA domain-containing protein 2-like [Patiria miniata]|uniref:SERTA domain-containing protein n=1 Tax=Patiria miniata TaxID=46514 RepID=A0A914BBW5_PATMI|nr:SERTA domain-containing protein 2-like [Patiria miniata]XP_038073724.1 SERTA domain-containing protein 2-like [Patiria miniata]XP_038073725.1 SERTA domain-containing protein 2-like [Patiria miniata]